MRRERSALTTRPVRPARASAPAALAFALAVGLGVASMPSFAVAPFVVLLVKQIVRDAVESTLKNALLSAIGGSGCKGQAIASALTTTGAVRSGGLQGLGALAGGMPGAGAMPSMAGLPSMPSMPLGGTPPPQSAMAGLLPFGAGTDLASAGLAKIAPHAAQIPADAIADAAQSAQIMAALSKPLSPKETSAVIDDMAAVGMLAKPVQGEIKECLVLMPAAGPALGMAFAMMKPAVAQMKTARSQMQALSPAEQDEVVAALSADLQALSPQERAAFAEFAGGGFFPPRMAAALGRALAAR